MVRVGVSKFLTVTGLIPCGVKWCMKYCVENFGELSPGCWTRSLILNWNNACLTVTVMIGVKAAALEC